MQYAPHDAPLPGAVAKEAQLSRGENFSHADGYSPPRDDANIAPDRNCVDRPGLAGQVEYSRRPRGEFLCGNVFPRLRRLIERNVSIDADAAEARIDSAALLNELANRPAISRIGKHPVLRPRR